MINGIYTVINQSIKEHSYLVNFRLSQFFSFPRPITDRGTPLASITKETFLKKDVFELLVPLEFLE